jgi:hypothetical protein
MKRISLVLAPLLLSAALVSPATAAPSSRTGCAADTSLVDRQFVEQAKVWTRTDRTFGYVRFFVGLRDGEQRYCVDLVVEDAFQGRHPRYRLKLDSLESSADETGHARTGKLDGGRKFATPGDKVYVSFKTFGFRTGGTMVLTVPDPR